MVVPDWVRPSGFPYMVNTTKLFPLLRTNAEPKDKSALPEPPSTEAESQASSETLATSTFTSAFEATSQVEGTLEQQQRNPKAGRPRQSPAQGASLRQMVVTHKKTPPGKKDHECNECGKASIYNSHLAIHQRIHSGEKPYKCSDCGKTFNQSSNLIQHQRMHTGEKPHECKECRKGKPLRWGSPLVQHRRIHSGEKPCECKKCREAFNQSSYLSQHLRIYSGEKPLVCKGCGKAYRWSSELIRHQRLHACQEPGQSVQGDRQSVQTNFCLIFRTGFHKSSSISALLKDADFLNVSLILISILRLNKDSKSEKRPGHVEAPVNLFVQEELGILAVKVQCATKESSPTLEAARFLCPLKASNVLLICSSRLELLYSSQMNMHPMESGPRLLVLLLQSHSHSHRPGTLLASVEATSSTSITTAPQTLESSSGWDSPIPSCSWS
nr:LOW QUALITY PROTEIN: zinc finger protein 502-like [Oryctolagus cuniculus]